MKNIILNSGKNVIVNENSLTDMMETVREELSPEISDSLEEMISDKLYDIEEERNALRQEMGAYESDLEDAQFALHDVVDGVEELIQYISSSARMDRKKLLENLRIIYNRANSIL